jgi:hypothetical protein
MGFALAHLSFLRTAVSIHAPHHLHLIPDRLARDGERTRTPAEQMAELGVKEPNAADIGPAPRPDVTLTPEQLAVARTDAGVRSPATPAATPPPANDRPTPTEDTPELWTPNWMTDAAD